jgi:hypothetical protein
VIAQEVLDTVEGRDLERNATMWELATAAEACVALDKPEDAIRWIQRYVECDDADAFELASTRRQFLEVWQLHDSSGIGAYILPPLNARLLQRSGGKVDVDARGFREARELSDARATLQRVLSDALYVSVAWWERGRARCQPVARIETELDADRGIGTGFLVRGGDLKDSLGDALFLLTNAHVISNDPRVADSLPLEKAYVSFKALGADGGRKRYRPMSLLWTSPPQELDATLLALETPLEGVEPCPLAGTLPLRDGSARIYVIGYPKGGGLSFSINDNLLLDYDTRLLHYRAPTEGGSSGSPVFNQNWEAIGIHHGGGLEMPRLNNNPGKYPANEGIWIQAIRKALEQ